MSLEELGEPCRLSTSCVRKISYEGKNVGDVWQHVVQEQHDCIDS